METVEDWEKRKSELEIPTTSMLCLREVGGGADDFPEALLDFQQHELELQQGSHYIYAIFVPSCCK